MLQQMFEWQKERIFARDHAETWFMSARSWAKSANDEDLGLTMAGLHSDYVMAILDESGGMPVPILNAAEGVLSSPRKATSSRRVTPTPWMVRSTRLRPARRAVEGNRHQRRS